jgi:hypothetical protein
LTHWSPDGFVPVVSHLCPVRCDTPSSSPRAPWLTPKYRRAWTSRSTVWVLLAIVMGEDVKSTWRTGTFAMANDGPCLADKVTLHGEGSPPHSANNGDAKGDRQGLHDRQERVIGSPNEVDRSAGGHCAGWACKARRSTCTGVLFAPEDFVLHGEQVPSLWREAHIYASRDGAVRRARPRDLARKGQHGAARDFEIYAGGPTCLLREDQKTALTEWVDRLDGAGHSGW